MGTGSTVIVQTLGLNMNSIGKQFELKVFEHLCFSKNSREDEAVFQKKVLERLQEGTTKYFKWVL